MPARKSGATRPLKQRAEIGLRPLPAPTLPRAIDDDGNVRALRCGTALYLAASSNSLHWEMLAQAAQATTDTELLALAAACHPQTLRQIRWTNTLIKIHAPQALTSV